MKNLINKIQNAPLIVRKIIASIIVIIPCTAWFVGTTAIEWAIWYYLTESDVLYLIGWYAILLFVVQGPAVFIADEYLTKIWKAKSRRPRRRRVRK